MPDVLEKICAAKREHIQNLKQSTSFWMMDSAARKADPPRGFAAALQTKASTQKIGLITEIKKASPSAGLLRPTFSPADLAITYEKAGATCLSVLTDMPYFQGNNDDLMAARAACTRPVLRKDFMLDVWQVAESRSLGADCILLIMAALDDATARDLHAAAQDYGMDVLIETHDEEELERALKLPSGLIGINNRNLKTLVTDLQTTERLSRYVPENRILVSESGIQTRADIDRLSLLGTRCFLVGEWLLKQEDVGLAVTNLLTPAPA